MPEAWAKVPSHPLPCCPCPLPVYRSASVCLLSSWVLLRPPPWLLASTFILHDHQRVRSCAVHVPSLVPCYPRDKVQTPSHGLQSLAGRCQLICPACLSFSHAWSRWLLGTWTPLTSLTEFPLLSGVSSECPFLRDAPGRIVCLLWCLPFQTESSLSGGQAAAFAC